jgi:predicted nucleic acid-binding protein
MSIIGQSSGYPAGESASDLLHQPWSQRAAIRVQEGLMTSDSVTVALKRKMGLTDVATFDADLDHVSHLSVYQPGDIPSRQP